MIRPDFSGGDRDYSEPADRIDTGEYAVDRYPSDADVGHRAGSEAESDGSDEEPSVNGSDPDDPDGDGGDGRTDADSTDRDT